MRKYVLFQSMFLLAGILSAQDPLFKFGEEMGMQKMISGEVAEARPVKWFQVNTDAETWKLKGEELICFGHPIGVIRSEKKYKNFILHIEWKHMEPGGNSGTFVWSNADPGDNRLPNGVEVQMLELEWVNLNTRDGEKPPDAYVHGELFGVGGVETIPDNPRGRRSKSIENRCKGKGEWNTYDVVCVDGTIKLSVNGKFVNGISKSTKKDGFICLESEGAEIHFRNLKVIALP
jgi:hypothetical protein